MTLQINTFSLIEKLAGVPMINNDFNCQLLITLIAHHRCNTACKDHPLKDCIHPGVAYKIYSQYTTLKTDIPVSTSVGNEQQQILFQAIEEIKKIMPLWSVYFSLPLEFRMLVNSPETVSLTNHCIPQVIYLGEKAFKTNLWLEEVIIHELSHVWLGMICELKHLHQIKSSQRFTLPSGTKNKDARGVIFAAHFAATVLKYLRAKVEKGVDIPCCLERIEYLKSYFSGCINILNESALLDKVGINIVERLKFYEVLNG